MPWLLPSLSRSFLAQAALESFEETGMQTPGMLIVDPPHDGYRDLRLPEGWFSYLPTEGLGMAGAMRAFFELYPRADYYGWLADDMIAVTPGWDERLIEAAGRWNIACCDDDDLARHSHIRDGVLPGAQVFGGDLVRAVGFWAIPGVQQGGIDDWWMRLTRELGNRVYLDDVLVRHNHYRTGRRIFDTTDLHVRNGVDYIANDRRTMEAFCAAGGLHDAVERVRKARGF